MTTRRRFLGALAALPPSLSLGLARAANDISRQALVIGNCAYAEAPLANPVNDARAMARLLDQAGFAVSSHLDATRVDMMAAIERFGAVAGKAETRQVVFYFAGHGAQLDWRNYLLPVDARAESAAQLRQSCIDLNHLIGELGKSRGKTFIVILDACRNNPFGSSYRPEQKGLSQFDAPANSLLAYATSPGRVAADGAGSNGLYTENLLRELSVAGTRLEDAMKRVRLNVRLASGGNQIPWETTSLESDFFLFADSQRTLSETEQEKLLQDDLAEWGRIKSSTRMDDYAGYLRAFPSGRFAEIVQGRLSRLLAEAEKSRPAVAPPAAQADSAPTIRLGPGLAVPLFMAPSDNPYSVGSYPLGRNYAVGDSATFRQTDTLTGVEQRSYTMRVTKVDRAADRVELNDGQSIADLMGNPLKLGPREYDAPVQNFPAELQLGKSWKAMGQLKHNGITSSFYYDFQIVARETVSVPAGSFDSFVIEGNGWSRIHGSKLSNKFWVVPGLNFAVRRDFVTRNRHGGYMDTERHELVELTQGAVDTSCAVAPPDGAQRNLMIRNNCEG